MACSPLFLVAVLVTAAHGAELGIASRKILQATYPNGGTTVTVSASKPRVDAIAITPSLPYPQTKYYCNVTGDSRIPAAGAVFPLTVRVPVGVEATVVFANVTGTIPGTGCSSVVQQPGTSVVQQPGTSVVQQPGTSVVQQPGTSVVQQPGTSVVQQPGTSVVQQPGTSVVQQPGTSVVQQPGTQGPASAVVQPGTSVGCSSVVQQPGTSVVQQPGTSVVQQPKTGPAGSVVQQPPTPPAGVVQQKTGKKLLQAPAPVEFISNNGSMGQPQLTVLDTVEGVPSISFKPTSQGQTAVFRGGLQVAVTTTNDGFGSPFIPYRADVKLSPDCGVTVNFVAV